MTTLVTGGAGFVGSHLISVLLERGERVAIIDQGARLAAARRRWGTRVRVAEAEITDPEAVAAACNQERVDVVVHLAYVLSAESDRDELLAAHVNCVGTTAILEAARQAGVGRVVLMSSIAVYGAPEMYPDAAFPLNEQAAPFVNDRHRVYAAGKVYQEQLALHYAARHGLSTCGLRASVIFGPGRAGGASTFAVSMVEEPLRGRPFHVAKSVSTQLSLVYVGDIAKQLDKLCQAHEGDLVGNRFFNTGGEAVSIGMIAEAIREQLPDARFTFDPQGEPYHDGMPSQVSDGLFVGKFGLSRRYDLRSGIAAYVKALRAAG